MGPWAAVATATVKRADRLPAAGGGCAAPRPIEKCPGTEDRPMNRRFALIQAIVSLVALAAVVWWASKQEAPTLPNTAASYAWMVAALALYAVATLFRGERWHRILYLTGVDASRADSYALITVGYMGNNVLPARAGEVLRVVLMAGRTGAGKREVAGTVVSERRAGRACARTDARGGGPRRPARHHDPERPAADLRGRRHRPSRRRRQSSSR